LVRGEKYHAVRWRALGDEESLEIASFLEEHGVLEPQNWPRQRWTPSRPVVGISWYEAVAYCRWLSEQAGIRAPEERFRLPTEGEWTMAARGKASSIGYPW
jgi:formylglycine-generating enzyme required for sulfatase activity